MSAILFLGPSAPAEAAVTAGIEVRPPARMGDVYQAALGQPRVIGIVDGFFEQMPAVWHKEILFALARGIRVVGGASMGALRATELDSFGMIGVGRIYRDFATGVIEDDDEVAVVHGAAEDGYCLLSEAMVNIRCGLEAARDAGLIREDQRSMLIAAAKAAFYPRRSWDLVCGALEAEAGREAAAALRRFVGAGAFDQKRADALETIRVVAEIARAEEPAPPPSFDFEWTWHWEQGIVNGAASRGRGSERAGQAALPPPPSGTARVLTERALLHHLAECEARRSGTGEDMAAALARFRLRRGLGSAAALDAWMRGKGLSRRECLTLARREALVEALARERAEEVDAALAGLLKLDGEFDDIMPAGSDIAEGSARSVL
jgi:hypothetical protein